MLILSIDTSCDETAAAVTDGRRVLSNVIYSQALLHSQWGGVVPSIAKRAHEEKIDFVVGKALKKYKMSDINAIAVTQGPGLAVALEVGIKKAKELAIKYHKQLIAVNHMEGHIYSNFIQNSKGNPKREFRFPYLALLISGGHTELVLFEGHLKYKVIGETLDDASGEALDKAGKILGLGYPAGTVIERLAAEVNNVDMYKFPRPMLRSANLNFSFSGLKTSFYYYLKNLSEKEIAEKIRFLASSFQEAVFDTLVYKTEKAMKTTGVKNLIVGGGVIANLYLRKKLRKMIKIYSGSILFPPYKYLAGDNAAMIGVVGYFKIVNNLAWSEADIIDRMPKLSLMNKVE